MRFVCVFFIALLSGLSPAFVYAASPTPTPNAQATFVPGGVYNEPVFLRPNITGNSTAPNAEVTVQTGASMHASSFQFPDLSLPKTMFLNAAPYLLPISVLEKTVPEEDNLVLSGRTALYVDFLGKTFPIPVSNNLYKVALSDWHLLDQGTQQLQFLQYTKSLRPDETGNFTFTRTPQLLQDTPTKTGNDTGSPQESQPAAVLESYEPMSWIQNLTRSLVQNLGITFASKQLLPYAKEVYDNTRGLAQNFAPSTHDLTKGEPVHGEQENEIALGKTTTRTENTKGIENASSYILCSLLPLQHQSDYGLDCKNYAKETTSCGATLPDFTIRDPSCNLCNAEDVANISSTFFPNGRIPETMTSILEKAGDVYHVPPNMLLLTLFTEGGHPNYLGGATWTEENVQDWSFCGQTMPFCTPNTQTALLPFGIKPSVFEQYKTAVSDVYPERNGQENPCNFMDQAFAAAKILAQNMNTRLPTTITGVSGGTCLGVPVSQLTATRNASSCNWSDLDMYRGRLMYLRYCPETGKTNGFSPNDQTWNVTRMFATSFQCQ